MLFIKFVITSVFVTLTLADSFTLKTSTSTLLQCTTSYGAQSVALPLKTTTSSTTVHLLPCIGTSIYTPTSTVTPSPTTSTSTVQQTVTVTITDSTVTDIFSTTSTILTTETDTVDVTSTSTETDSFSTIIDTTTTIIVPTSSGFLPVDSTTATAYPNTPSRRFKPRNNQPAPKKKGGPCAGSHPESVRCIDYVEYFSTIIYIHTITAKTTTLPPKTSVTTTTITSTSTSTVVPPDISITSSFTTTSTISTTTTSTAFITTTTSTTSTLTITSTSSLYAACTPASNNFLGPQFSNGLIEVYAGGGSGVLADTATTAYDCCVKCQLSNSCAGTFFDGSNCFEIQSNQCSSQAETAVDYESTTTDVYGEEFIVSNGNCGYMYYGGSQN